MNTQDKISAKVAMNAHGDVVPPGAGWSASPYSGEVRDGWLYGRGTVELHLTYDEETGGMTGPHWILSQRLSRPDYVLSAAFSHHVVTAHNGCLHLEITLRGLSAHAALPDTGHDAIEASVPLLAALYRYRDALAHRVSQTPGIDHPTLVVGLIQGGNVLLELLVNR
jgi:succinyl-diaminopimelate desuccinylase